VICDGRRHSVQIETCNENENVFCFLLSLVESILIDTWYHFYTSEVKRQQELL
jgi:hypothetical protein